MKNFVRLLIVCLCFSLFLSGCYKESPAKEAELLQYQYAQDLLNRNKYERAIEQLIGLIGYKDSTDLLIESSCKIAELSMEIENYKNVIETLPPVLQALQQSRVNKKSIATIQIALGKAYFEIGEFDQACSLFEDGKEYSGEAKEYLNQIELLIPFQGEWQRSDYDFPFSYCIKGRTITYSSGYDRTFSNTLMIKDTFLEDENSEYQYVLKNEELIITALDGATFREGRYYKM